MKKNAIIGLLICVIIIVVSNCDNPPEPIPNPDKTINSDYDILLNGKIVPSTGFGMGVDDSAQKRNWLRQDSVNLCLRMLYPVGLQWGAVFITVRGDPVQPPRPFVDISGCDTLAIEMRGDKGSCVKVGLKDKDDSDDGTEAKINVSLTDSFQWYYFPLSIFSTCDLHKVYVIPEFVFPCEGNNNATTIEVRNIRLLK